MNVLIYGSGALGIFLAQKLGPFFDVDIYTPRRKYKNLFFNNKPIKVKILNDINFHKTYDLVIVTIPFTFSTLKEISEIKKIKLKYITTLQNGIIPLEIFQKEFKKQFIKSLCTFSSKRIKNNHAKGNLDGGELIFENKNIIKLEKELKKIGARFVYDFNNCLLNKFIFYSIVSAICAISNKTVNELITVPKKLNLLKKALKEACSYYKIKTDEPFPIRLILKDKNKFRDFFSNIPEEIIPSFMQHYKLNETTEFLILIDDLINRIKKNNKYILKVRNLTLKKLIKHPFVLTWRITYSCNLNCKYCSSIRPKKEYTTIEKNNIDRLFRFIDYHNIRALILTGGEPLIVKNLDSIVRMSKKRNLYLGIVTNGTLIGKYAKMLSKFDYIAISLDSFKSKINDINRGKGSTKRVLTNLKNNKSLWRRIDLMNTITKENIDYIDDYISKGKKFGKFAINMVRNLSVLECSKNKLKLLIKKLKHFKNLNRSLIDPKSYFDYCLDFLKTGIRPDLKCHAGEFFIKVDPKGNIICYGSRFNIFKDSFDKFKMKTTKIERCKTCFCNRDVINMYLEGKVSFNELPRLTQELTRRLL